MNKLLKWIKSLFKNKEAISKNNKLVNSSLNVNLSMFKDKKGE